VTSRERADRDGRIVAARLRGRAWAAIAAKFEITERQAQRIVSGWRQREPGLADRDSVAEVEEVLALQTQAIADLAELFEGDVQASVKVAAITRRVEIAERRLVFMRSFGALRAEAEARELLDQFLRVLGEHRDSVPSALFDDLQAVVADGDNAAATASPTPTG
jgi:hypothetical protein